MTMKTVEERGRAKPHILVFPYPTQGHINPMLQFAKRLSSKGLTISLVTTRFIAKSTHADMASVNLVSFSDGFDEGGRDSAPDIQYYLEKFRAVGSQSLTEAIDRMKSSSACPPSCLVYDSFVLWALDVAKGCGLAAASFLTQSCAVCLVYYHIHKGLLNCPPSEKTVLLPGLPEFELSELPSFVTGSSVHNWLLDFVVHQLSLLDKADWVLCNNFYELEQQEMSFMKTLWPVKAAGPTLPSKFLDARVEGDNDYGLSLWKKEDELCRNWMQDKEAGTVVYVSFGSLSTYSSEQMEEIACALIESNYCFLWVVRATEESKLPNDFAETVAGKGLTVRWASQLEILAHQGVGCFVTHCGWSSTLEGLSLGVPMVGVPYWSDQPSNAKYIEQVWKVGVRARADGKGVVRKDEIRKCIEMVMNSSDFGGRREEMIRNVGKWKSLALLALGEGGSSDKDIDDFVTDVSKF